MAIVYKHFKKDTKELFYIGIGVREKRAYEKRIRNNLWYNIMKKHGYYVEIYKKDIDLETAKAIEIKLIEQYGRIDLGTGILSNMTAGGHLRVFSQKTKDKISNSLKGKKQSEETKLKRSLTLKKVWKNENLRELKRQQTTNLIKEGILKTRLGIPNKHKGEPFTGDKEKLSKSLKKYYENAKPHNFKYIDKETINGIIHDYQINKINKFQLHKKYNLNRKIIERLINNEIK